MDIKYIYANHTHFEIIFFLSWYKNGNHLLDASDTFWTVFFSNWLGSYLRIDEDDMGQNCVGTKWPDSKSYTRQKFLLKLLIEVSSVWRASTKCGQKVSTLLGRFLGSFKIVLNECMNGKEEKCSFKFFLSDVHYSMLPTSEVHWAC